MSTRLCGLADGVIVGSAIVRQMESLSADTADPAETLRHLGEFAAKMVTATHRE